MGVPLVLMFVWWPESEQIAHYLNAKDAKVCEHGRDPCIMRCGVRKSVYLEKAYPNGELEFRPTRPRLKNEGLVWRPIHIQERIRWLNSVLSSAPPNAEYL